jgi:hypothetical protein
MAKLFVSHASEDKDAFVRPLAEKLRQIHEVWYDEYSLKLGDSLRASIDAGLRACDFGVVILSPSFFAKKWTNMELSGLVALESAARKMILPVWLNVTAQQVLEYSPILADRKAVSAGHGIDAVVSEISGAIIGSTHTADLLAPDEVSAALTRAVGMVRSKMLDEKILRTEEGVKLHRAAVSAVVEEVWRRLEKMNSATPMFTRIPNGAALFVQGPMRVSLTIDVGDAFVNTAMTTTLDAVVSRVSLSMGPLGEVTPEKAVSWLPTCATESTVAFRQKGRDEIFTPHDVARIIVRLVAEMTEEAVRAARG